MTESELKKLAVDVVEGRVFGSWMLPSDDQHLVAAIFLPLALGGSNVLPDDVWGVYEYTDRSKKDKIRGKYPTFMTCKYLVQADCAVLNPLIEQYTELKSSFLEQGGT